MIAIEAMTKENDSLSLRKALRYSGMSSCAYYYKPNRRIIEPDPSIVSKTKEVSFERPTFGTRRMAAMLSRELEIPINRKRVQKIFRFLNWVTPSKNKKEIIRSASKVAKASRPYELWQTDLTYAWCGVDRWCYLFNVLDVFQREWAGYAFDTSAAKENAIMSVNNALAAHREVKSDLLTLRCDNGPQYTSNAFTNSMKALGIKLEYIAYNTPEQNGHIESFHKTLKKEYLWPEDFKNYQEAEIAIAQAFKDYNQERIHSSLGYKTPCEFLSEWRGLHHS